MFTGDLRLHRINTHSVWEMDHPASQFGVWTMTRLTRSSLPQMVTLYTVYQISTLQIQAREEHAVISLLVISPVTNPLSVDSMCEVQRKASSGKALLLFLVTCMHDVMHAVCMLCAVWRTTDTVICGTEWFLVHDWTFWKLCERTRNPETLPDLEQLI